MFAFRIPALCSFSVCRLPSHAVHAVWSRSADPSSPIPERWNRSQAQGTVTLAMDAQEARTLPRGQSTRVPPTEFATNVCQNLTQNGVVPVTLQ